MLAMLDPCKIISKMSAVANGKKIDISIMQLLIALHLTLIVANSWMPFLSNDVDHNIIAVIINSFKHIVIALTRQIRQFLNIVLIFYDK